MLIVKYSRFRWYVTESTNSITTERGIVRVKTSLNLLAKMDKEVWDQSRDIKNDIVARHFSINYPNDFKGQMKPVYSPGTLAKILDSKMMSRLSDEDRDTLTKFIPEFVARESVGIVSKLKAEAQIKSLKAMAEDLEEAIKLGHSESWWQEYIKSNILLIQQGYIKAFDKLNVALGTTKYPDFLLITHDNYLDILEIKKPNTPILKEDTGRKNFYWDTEVSKAIIQTENYIAFVGGEDKLRSHILDEHEINVKALRPRGIILVGDASSFSTQKEKDDFRLLSHGLKNITILTYDELLTRLKNNIAVLEVFSRKAKSAKSRSKLKLAKVI